MISFFNRYSPALGHGRVYGDTALPWIPSGLFTTVSNAQVNWIAAYSDTAVYIVLLSQSFNDESVSCVRAAHSLFSQYLTVITISTVSCSSS